MVVCIHAPFAGLVGKIVTPLTRIAVPLFFMITGYYYASIKERKREKDQLNKIFRLFFSANLLFFAWSLLKALLASASVPAEIGKLLRIKSILKFVLLNDSPFGQHLWYLGAILYVLVIILLVEKSGSGKSFIGSSQFYYQQIWLSASTHCYCWDAQFHMCW